MAIVPIMVNAQQISMENIGKAGLRNSGPIIKNNEVQGYYFFYRLDEKSKKTRVYLLDIYDENLESIAKKRITGSKYLYLMESAFDGENVMFKFYDGKERRFSFRVYNQQAEFVTKKDREWDKRNSTLTVVGDDVQSNSALFAIPNKGFVNYNTVKNKRVGYEIEYFNSTVGKRGWKYRSDAEVKEYRIARFLDATENMLVNMVIHSAKRNSYYISAIDVATGKEKFKLLLNDDKYDVELMKATIDEEAGEILAFGEYYTKGVKTEKEVSIGLFAFTISLEGELLTKKRISWIDDVGKHIPVDEKGRVQSEDEKGKGYIWFHKIIRTNDGKIFAIGEQFRKAVDGAGIAMNVLTAAANSAAGGNFASTDAGVMKIVIEDLMIFQFDNDFNLEDVVTIDKGKENFNLPKGMGLMNTQRIASWIDLLGAFDYSFSQVRDEGANFSTIFVDYKKEKGEKGEFRMGAVSYQDGEIIETYMPLEKEKSETFKIHPGKPGYIIITEYFRKEKRLSSRLEKINF